MHLFLSQPELGMKCEKYLLSGQKRNASKFEPLTLVRAFAICKGLNLLCVGYDCTIQIWHWEVYETHPI